MRVLMTTDAVGGVWTYALDLIEALPDDVEVVLATMGPRAGREQRDGVARVAPAAFVESGFALEWMDEPWNDLKRAGEWLLELREEVGADLVHLNGYVHATVPFGVPVVVVGHSCVLSWHEAVRGVPAGPEWSRYAAAVAAGLRAADAVVAPTRAMLEALERIYGLGSGGIVIPNGRAAAGDAPGVKEPLVLGVGRVWDEGKNLAALQRLAPRLPWSVRVVGDGGDVGRVPAEELRDLYGRAAVFAAPAAYEPFGLSALEAGLSACALVLGDVASLREVWGEAALFVDGSDADLLRALRRLIEDEALRADLSRRARERALGYSADRMADAYRALYLRLAAPQLVGAA